MPAPAHRRPNLIAFAVIMVLVTLWLNRHELLDQVREPQSPSDLDLDHPVVMFSTSWCPYCTKARTWFAEHQVDFVEYDVEKSPQAAAHYRKLRGRGTPLVVIGDEVIQGYSPLQMELAVRMLRERDRKPIDIH